MTPSADVMRDASSRIRSSLVDTAMSLAVFGGGAASAAAVDVPDIKGEIVFRLNVVSRRGVGVRGSGKMSVPELGVRYDVQVSLWERRIHRNQEWFVVGFVVINKTLSEERSSS